MSRLIKTPPGKSTTGETGPPFLAIRSYSIYRGKTGQPPGLRFRNEGLAYRLDLDQPTRKDKGIHTIRDAAKPGVGSPLEEQDIFNIGRLDTPLRLRNRLKHAGEESAYGIIAAHYPILSDERGSVSIVPRSCIKLFSI